MSARRVEFSQGFFRAFPFFDLPERRLGQLDIVHRDSRLAGQAHQRPFRTLGEDSNRGVTEEQAAQNRTGAGHHRNR